jgi:hypothetical protein
VTDLQQGGKVAQSPDTLGLLPTTTSLRITWAIQGTEKHGDIAVPSTVPLLAGKHFTSLVPPDVQTPPAELPTQRASSTRFRQEYSLLEKGSIRYALGGGFLALVGIFALVQNAGHASALVWTGGLAVAFGCIIGIVSLLAL